MLNKRNKTYMRVAKDLALYDANMILITTAGAEPWTERSCKQCGQNHGYRPNFEGVKTGLDIISELNEFMISIENHILRTALT
jgi:hypothetical protein